MDPLVLVLELVVGLGEKQDKWVQTQQADNLGFNALACDMAF